MVQTMGISVLTVSFDVQIFLPASFHWVVVSWFGTFGLISTSVVCHLYFALFTIVTWELLLHDSARVGGTVWIQLHSVSL